MVLGHETDSQKTAELFFLSQETGRQAGGETKKVFSVVATTV